MEIRYETWVNSIYDDVHYVKIMEDCCVHVNPKCGMINILPKSPVVGSDPCTSEEFYEAYTDTLQMIIELISILGEN